ncbi:NAD(P)-dependent oxidoreductase [Caldiplasma sukawensis]
MDKENTLLLMITLNQEDRKKIMDIGQKYGVNIEFYRDGMDLSEYKFFLFGFGKLREISKYTNMMKNPIMIQSLSAGVDMVDLRSIPKGTVFCSNAGAYSVPVAEHAFSMYLALSKNLLTNHMKMREGIFDQNTESDQIKGKTAGIIGYGGIGKEIGRLCKGAGMNLFVISRKEEDNVDFFGTLDKIDYVLRNSDVIFISIPLNKYTRNLIDKNKLNMMKEEAIIINVARGDIIKEEDLYEHLKSHKKFRAGIDTWWHEHPGRFSEKFDFLSLPNVLGSPHNSGIVKTMEQYEKAIENVSSCMRGERPKNIVKMEDYFDIL